MYCVAPGALEEIYIEPITGANATEPDIVVKLVPFVTPRPSRSRSPPVSLTINIVDGSKGWLGVKVALIPFIATATVPAIGICVCEGYTWNVAVVTVKGSIG